MKSKPKDFTWDELAAVMKKLGFSELQGSGSRVKFYNLEKDRAVHLHKPHPTKILKRYALNEVIELLTKEKLI